MHDVHTRTLLWLPATIARTVCKLMFQRRFVTLWAWLIRQPNIGPRPHISHTFAIDAHSCPLITKLKCSRRSWVLARPVVLCRLTLQRLRSPRRRIARGERLLGRRGHHVPFPSLLSCGLARRRRREFTPSRGLALAIHD